MIKLFLFLVTLSFSAPVFSQEGEKPKGNSGGRPSRDGLQVSLGVLSMWRTNIFANGDDRDLMVFPNLSLQYKKFALRGNKIIYSFFSKRFLETSNIFIL